MGVPEYRLQSVAACFGGRESVSIRQHQYNTIGASKNNVWLQVSCATLDAKRHSSASHY
jgi:hypothetical protein